MKIGDKVRTGVYVLGEFKPMWLGEIKSFSSDGTLAVVDRGSMHGCRPIISTEMISHLRLEN